MTEVTLPKFGVTMQEATIIEWFKDEGEEVTQGEPLVSIETDKVDAEIEAPSAGTLTERRCKAGDVVAVGTVVAVIADADSQ